jgi:toxin-antitoxin system PIN domain toxin
MNGSTAFAISEQVLTNVIRITTHPRIFKEPTVLGEAIAFTESIQEHPNCRVIRSSTRHWSSFVRLCKTTNAKANLVTGAWFAALAIESGCTWITTDRDFARFPGLTWQHPLDHLAAIENPK